MSTNAAPMTLAPADLKAVEALEQTIDELPFSTDDLRIAIAGMSDVKRVSVNVIEDNLLVNVVGGDACKITKLLKQRPAHLKLSLVFTDL